MNNFVISGSQQPLLKRSDWKILSFLEGIDENERQVELEKLSKHPCRVVVVERSFEQPLQNACRNLSKEGLKIKFDPMRTENTKNVQVAPTTGIGKLLRLPTVPWKKWTVPYIVGKYSGKSRKVNFFIKVIPSTLLLKLNFLFQILICKVNNLYLKQYFFKLIMLCIYATWKVIYRNL